MTDVPEVLGISPQEIAAWTPGDPSRYRAGTRLRYAGPIYARLAVPVPERVERFLAVEQPVVYVAITSSTPELVRAAVGAVRQAGVRVIVAATVHDLADLDDEQVLVAGVLPSHEIMTRVDLAVIGGGQGSVQSAIASGLAFAGIPLQPEQDANVAFIERQGAARLVPLHDVGTLTRIARELLADDRYRQNARRLQEAFARVDGPGAAADAIIELAA